MMKYKGYTGHVEFDDEANIFHGNARHRDVITFQGTPEEIKTAFRDSIDDYLNFVPKKTRSQISHFQESLFCA